jgi:hypothetical protein
VEPDEEMEGDKDRDVIHPPQILKSATVLISMPIILINVSSFCLSYIGAAVLAKQHPHYNFSFLCSHFSLFLNDLAFKKLDRVISVISAGRVARARACAYIQPISG